jgi:hypothetical protein
MVTGPLFSFVEHFKTRNMKAIQREKFLFSIIMACSVALSSCGQNEPTESKEETVVEEAVVEDVYSEPYQYGGWYCPDNLRGFPPVDVKHLDRIKVVADRLPTKEEAQNGTSLMYFDTTRIPDARPLPIKLPQLAWIHSEQTGFNEPVIVIQAVVAGTDTVVGYRFPSGGNGSAWIGQVTFFSEQEAAKVGSRPFVSVQSDIPASEQKIWESITHTDYAKHLADLFGKHEFFNSHQTPDSPLYLDLVTDSIAAHGVITSMWGMLYLQIDYSRGDHVFTEKMTLFEHEDGNSTLQFVAGPYPDNVEVLNKAWNNWLQEVKDGCKK